MKEENETEIKIVSNENTQNSNKNTINFNEQGFGELTKE